MKYDFLWITDPWNSLCHAQDTTLRLAQAAAVKGNRNFWAETRSVRWDGSTVVVEAREIKVPLTERRAEAVELAFPVLVRPAEFTRIVFRPDPPIKSGFVHALQLLVADLELCGRDPERTIVNSPSVLLGHNEKLFASGGGLMPKSIVTCDEEHLVSFAAAEVRTVIKPLHQHCSRGVHLIDWGSVNTRQAAIDLLRSSTENFSRPVMLQQYIASHTECEKRLWYVDGQLLAYGAKRPASARFPLDMDDGGAVVACELASREGRVAEELGRRLRERGVRIAGVDMIDGYITDVNFISPGLLVELETLTCMNLAEVIVDAIRGDKHGGHPPA